MQLSERDWKLGTETRSTVNESNQRLTWNVSRLLVPLGWGTRRRLTFVANQRFAGNLIVQPRNEPQHRYKIGKWSTSSREWSDRKQSAPCRQVVGSPLPLSPLSPLSLFCICFDCWINSWVFLAASAASLWIWSIVLGLLSSRRGTHFIFLRSLTSCNIKRTLEDVFFRAMIFSICWKYWSTRGCEENRYII